MRTPIAALLLLIVLASAGCGPAATFTPNPAALNFGAVYLGLSASLTTTWTSTYSAPVFPALSVVAPFSCSANSIPQVPANGSTGPLTFTFSPTAVGAATGAGNMGLTDANFAPVPVTATGVSLSGTGAAQTSDATLSLAGGDLVAGAVLDFGMVVVGTTKALTFNVANATAQQVTVTATVLARGPYATAPVTLVVRAKGALAVTVTFAPTKVGVYPDAVEFTLGPAGKPTARAGTAVSGEGIAVPPPPPK